jgi:hypothetical protein
MRIKDLILWPWPTAEGTENKEGADEKKGGVREVGKLKEDISYGNGACSKFRAGQQEQNRVW